MKDSEAGKRAQRKYYQTHRAERLAYTKRYRKSEKGRESRQRYREKYREELKAYNRKYQKEKRKEAIRLLGGCCCFCGHDVHLNFHKKSGGRHGASSGTPYAVLKNPKEWALVCMNCHKAVHWCMEHLGLSWEEIEKKYVIRL